MNEQLDKIFRKEKEDDLYYLLRSASAAERKEMVPDIKFLAKHYNEYEKGWDGSYKIRGSDKQIRMCTIACFVCFTQDDFAKQFFAGSILKEEILFKVIEWYIPDWFSNFVNKLAEGDNFSFLINYDILIKLTEAGILKPGKPLIARVLINVPYGWRVDSRNEHHRLFNPEKLLERPVTIEEHIWHIFDVASPIDNLLTHNRGTAGKPKYEGTWIEIFKKFSSEGILDRGRVLKESLLASNKNFDRNLCGWFADMFVELEPGEQELIELQPHLFSVLNAPNSKPVNTALNAIKKIATIKGFDIQGFVDQSPVLLASSTKNVIASALMILEKLAKKNVSARSQISRSAMHVFMQADDELQLKGAKIIHACRDSLDASFAEELMVYEGSIMSSARNLLQDLFTASANTTAPAAEEPQSPAAPVEWAPIPSIENIDDFFFLASQVLDNNQSWHIDFLPAMLLKFRMQIVDGNISKLEPALQRALKLNRSGLVSTQGYLDQLLSMFLIDVCIHFVRKYPDQAGSLRQLFAKFDRNEEPARRVWLEIDEKSSYVGAWDTYYKDKFYRPYRHLLVMALEMLRNESELPLLSTPTHEPGWLHPVQLTERIAAYHAKGIDPDTFDWQIAVSRCMLENTDHAIGAAEKLLSGEKLNLLLFLFGKHTEPQGPFTNKAVWMAASLAQKVKKRYEAFESFSYYEKPFVYYTGQHAWQTTNEEFTNQRWEYKTGKYVKFQDHRKALNLLYPKIEKKEEPKKPQEKTGFFSKLFSKPEKPENTEKPDVKDDGPLLCDFMSASAAYFSFEHNDMRRLFLLMPNNPEPLLAEITRTCLKEPVLSAESTRKTVIAVLQVMYEIWNNAGSMAHLFLGTCMLASDKTVGNIAGEIWLKGISAYTVDTGQVGKVIGIHEKIDFAPLKRFTDLVSQQLFRVSTFHNKQLQYLFENIFAELPDEPIKGLKKLIEIYTELLAVNKAMPSEAISTKLQRWKKTK